MSVFPEHFEKDEKELNSKGSGSYDDDEHRVNTQHSFLALRTIDDDSSEEEPNELSLTFMPGNEALDEFDQFFEATNRDEGMSEIAEKSVFGM